MANSSTFAAGSQGPTTMVPVSVVFACKHAELTTMPYGYDSASVGFMLNDRHCSAPACQKRFVNKMRSELQLAGMNCKASLRKFTMVEPMLKEEMASVGCSADLVEALLNCSQRSAATATYLGHRALLSSLAEYETSVDQGQANSAHAMHLIFSLQAVQHKLMSMQSTVLRLSQTSYPAPGLKFPMLEGIQSHEPSWGKAELSALKTTDEGRAILALPLAPANILAAKSTVLSATNELAELAQLQSAERASFFSDYPGTEALYASGAMRSSAEMLEQDETSLHDSVTESFGELVIDTTDDDDADADFSSADIRSLRPARVLSKSMAVHKRKCAGGLDMGKIHAYSGKSYTALTNPWWTQAK